MAESVGVITRCARCGHDRTDHTAAFDHACFHSGACECRLLDQLAAAQREIAERWGALQEQARTMQLLVEENEAYQDRAEAAEARCAELTQEVIRWSGKAGLAEHGLELAEKKLVEQEGLLAQLRASLNEKS